MKKIRKFNEEFVDDSTIYLFIDNEDYGGGDSKYMVCKSEEEAVKGMLYNLYEKAKSENDHEEIKQLNEMDDYDELVDMYFSDEVEVEELTYYEKHLADWMIEERKQHKINKEAGKFNM